MSAAPFSDPVAGEAVTDDLPIYVAWRLVPGAGPEIRTRIDKRTAAVLDYRLDFRSELGVGERITHAVARVRPVVAGGLTITRLQFNALSAVIWLAGGLTNGRFDVQVEVVTSLARTIFRNFVVITDGETITIVLDTHPTTGGVGAPGADALVLGDPGLAVWPQTLTFAATAIGATSVPLSVLIENTGSSTMLVESLACTGPFALSHDSVTGLLDPDETLALSIVFKPTAAGAATGTIIVDAGPTPGSPTQIDLAGTA